MLLKRVLTFLVICDGGWCYCYFSGWQVIYLVGWTSIEIGIGNKKRKEGWDEEIRRPRQYLATAILVIPHTVRFCCSASQCFVWLGFVEIVFFITFFYLFPFRVFLSFFFIRKVGLKFGIGKRRAKLLLFLFFHVPLYLLVILIMRIQRLLPENVINFGVCSFQFYSTKIIFRLLAKYGYFRKNEVRHAKI